MTVSYFSIYSVDIDNWKLFHLKIYISWLLMRLNTFFSLLGNQKADRGVREIENKIRNQESSLPLFSILSKCQ